MHIKTLILPVLLLAALSTACESSPSGTEASCKAVLAQRLADNMDKGANGQPMTSPTDKPQECTGLDDATLNRIAEEVITETLEDAGTARLAGARAS